MLVIGDCQHLCKLLLSLTRTVGHCNVESGNLARIVVYFALHIVGLQRIKNPLAWTQLNLVLVSERMRPSPCMCSGTRWISKRDVHTPSSSLPLSMAVLHASFRDRISIFYTYAWYIATRKDTQIGPLDQYCIFHSLCHLLYILPFASLVR